MFLSFSQFLMGHTAHLFFPPSSKKDWFLSYLPFIIGKFQTNKVWVGLKFILAHSPIPKGKSIHKEYYLDGKFSHFYAEGRLHGRARASTATEEKPSASFAFYRRRASAVKAALSISIQQELGRLIIGIIIRPTKICWKYKRNPFPPWSHYSLPLDFVSVI